MNEPIVENFTVDPQGFVLVEGARVVNNAAGDLLKHRASFNCTCQQCGQSNVPTPMVVVSEFESAMGRRKYWNRLAQRPQKYCDTCV